MCRTAASVVGIISSVVSQNPLEGGENKSRDALDSPADEIKVRKSLSHSSVGQNILTFADLGIACQCASDQGFRFQH